MSNVAFARQVYLRRKDLKLSLRELARATGIAASTISRIENGHLSPTLDIVEKLTAALHLEQPGANTKPIVTQMDPDASGAGQEQPNEPLVPVVVYKKIRSTTLRKGIRHDLSRIAARNGYEMAVVVKGRFQLRTNDGFRQNLKPGATINCRLIATHTYFAVASDEAELLWIS